MIVREAAHLVVVLVEPCIGWCIDDLERLCPKSMVGFLEDLYSVTVHEDRITHSSWRPVAFVGFITDSDNPIVISLSLSTFLFFFVFHLIVASSMLRPHSVTLNRDKCVRYHIGHSHAYGTFVSSYVNVINFLSQRQ